MKITQNVRDYAAQQQHKEQENGLNQMKDQFKEVGQQLYIQI